MSSEPKTSRGRASRERILAAAADLIHRQGVHGTSVDEVLTASEAGKSQFYHYFDDKDDLIRGVLDFQVHRIFEEQTPYLEHVESFEGIARWFEAVVASHERRRWVGGCPIGTLAAEMADWDPELAQVIDTVFERWRVALAAGLSRMQQQGELREDADPESLAGFVVAVQQGATLLARTAKEPAVLRVALDHALRYLRSYGTGGARRGSSKRESSKRRSSKSETSAPESAEEPRQSPSDWAPEESGWASWL
jgi:TetR/AcrR family transcriptional repressor of nem operon